MTWSRTQYLPGKARVATLLAAFAAAVLLVSLASAAHVASRQQVAITSKPYPQATFVFTPLTVGPLKRDSGKVSVEDAGHNLVNFTFRGKRGTLVIRETQDWVDVADDKINGVTPAVSLGSWNAVRGTGQYRKVVGNGRSAQAGLGNVWYARQTGFLKSP